MKKLILFACALCMSVCAMAQSEFYVYKTDGSSVKFTIADVDSISFTAPADPANPANGHEYVDLGLSVKWATCNVGATAPEEYGNHYAWGETTIKTTYSWDTYTLTTDGGSTFTKYNTTDGKTTLEPEDDAATVNWGGTWRMPTNEEWQELKNNCTWTWVENFNGSGKNGYKVEGANGNSIFLPAAGYYIDGKSIGDVGSACSYWSSSLYTSNTNAWMELCYSSSDINNIGAPRYYGQSVRAVCE
ncbi:MAG: hypothetical protein ACI392_03580 [Paludibacteraceae bacterium]